METPFSWTRGKAIRIKIHHEIAFLHLTFFTHLLNIMAALYPYGLLGIRSDSNYQGSFFQLDASPEFLGAEIVEFLTSLSPEDFLLLQGLLDAVTWVDPVGTPDDSSLKYYTSKDYHFDSIDNSHPDAVENWGDLLLRVQELMWLPNVLNGNLCHIVDDINLLDDPDTSHWWAYFIDIASRVFLSDVS
jgi:hypothetical protein